MEQLLAEMMVLLLPMALLFLRVQIFRIHHLKCYFTVDEEIGLLGAVGLDCSVLKRQKIYQSWILRQSGSVAQVAFQGSVIFRFSASRAREL